MCGRYTQKTPASELAEQFDLAEVPAELGPRYNIAPTQPVLAVPNLPGPRKAEVMRWGLVPHWAKDPAIGGQLANARAETLREKPSFREPFARRRALLLMDGFFEWQTLGRLKVPHYFTVGSGGPFAVAALWSEWRPAPGAEVLRTVALITCQPNPLVAALHDRMAVILPRDSWQTWLDPAPLPPEALQPLLEPYAGEMRAVRVSAYVSAATNQGPRCIEPADGPPPAPKQPSLF